MIFNVNTGGEKLVLPILDPNYPNDADVAFGYNTGASATFNVSIASNGKPAIYTYQWYYDGTAIVGATGSSYTITNINTAGVHYVWCVVTNKAGSVETRHATLTAAPNYKIPVLNASYPADVNVRYDSGSSVSATFKIEIATAGEPDNQTYQWYYDDVAVDGATESTYTRSDINTTGTHNVYCLVTHVSGGTVKSRVATLTSRQTFKYNWTDGSNMAFYYGDGSSLNVSNIGAYNDYKTRYGQVLWFTTDAYGGTGYTFDWNPRAFAGDTKTVYCRITETRSDGCNNNSSDIPYTTTSSGYRFSDNSFVFKPNTTYYIYINRSSYDYGIHYYGQGSDPVTWGTSSITIH